MLQRGFTASALTGRSVRARGLVEAGRGVSLELAAPEMLEVLDQDRSRR
jgi:hypothetical protein